MKAGDYRTTNQARDYQQRRFGDGLSLVSKDEISLLKSWLDLISASRPNSYLDLGCGTGRITGELLRRNPKTVYALDTSAAMLTQLKKTYAKKVEMHRLKIITAPSDKIPLLSGSTDLITAFHLFKHLPDINSTLKEAYRVLRAGGYLIFDVLNRDSIVRLRLGSCYALSELEVQSKLQETGFTTQGVLFMHAFGETIYKMLGKKGAWVIHLIDKTIRKTNIKLGTKLFVLAKKNE